MLRFPRLIPSPFYTGWCLYIETGTQPAVGIPLWCHVHRHCVVLPTIRVGGMATTVTDSIGRTNDRLELESRRVIAIGSRTLLSCLQNFTLMCSCIYNVSLPLIIYAQLPAIWYSTCQRGFSAVESPPSQFHSSRPASNSKNPMPAQSPTAHLIT